MVLKKIQIGIMMLLILAEIMILISIFGNLGVEIGKLRFNLFLPIMVIAFSLFYLVTNKERAEVRKAQSEEQDELR